MVTGGTGHIGKVLIQRLLPYGPRRVVLISRSPTVGGASSHRVVRTVQADVRDRNSLTTLFARYRPDVVYHLAEKRLLPPSLGEIRMADMISTNVFGTRNIVDCSREFRARQCIVVSTAKAVQYVPFHVYDQTQKLEEWVTLAASVDNGPAYGVIRLPDVLDDSWLLHKMRGGMAKGLVALQTPHISFYAQQVGEAVDLLLNTLPLVEAGQARIVSSEDLGWPINLLDLALYKIYESGSRAGIYFTGTPPGNEGHVFQGVLDWTAPTRRIPHPLHNALEHRIEDPRTAAAGVRASYAPPCDAEIVSAVLDQLQRDASGIPDGSIRLRASLRRAVSRLALKVFSETSPERLVEIARWGASPSILRLTGTAVMHHRDTLIPLMQSLLPKVTPQLLFRSGWNLDEWETFLGAASEIPELKELVTERMSARRCSMG
ncbi:MAG: hypothetical protein A4E19_13535 [Nitrospira sp. SG-bin1]|nr:MAG: hypothetical protein A4E19_13535 [Nitrospira sp. SG-bin1]